jgi:transmembrane sensor
MRKTETHGEPSWLRGQLVFDEEMLANVAAELNRYSQKKIVIADPQVASRRLSAVLAAGDIDTFLAATQRLGLAKKGMENSERVELVAP